MVCAPRNSLIGISQELRYGAGANLISVTLDRKNFKCGEGDGLLKELGYARTTDQQFWRVSGRTTLGIPRVTGPSFFPPETFEWRLQGLTDLQYWSIDAMARLQQASRNPIQPIRLTDQRWAMSEPLPRTRAKIGAVVGPVLPGMMTYFAKFNILIEEISPPVYRNDGTHELTIKASELDKIPLTEDS